MRRNLGKFAAAAAIATLYAAFCVLCSSREVMHDASEYFHYGLNLAASGVYGSGTPGIPDMNREPGYGIFLGYCLKIFGDLFSTDSAKISLLVFCQGLFYSAAAFVFYFFAPLGRRVRLLFLAFQLSSSAALAANAEIYSETVAVSFLTLALLAALKLGSGKRWTALLAVSFATAVLTKAYLFYFVPFLFLCGVGLVFRPRSRSVGSGLLITALVSFFAQKAWDGRNLALFGEKQEFGRVAGALAGKVLRAEEMDPARDWKMGIAASVGNNFCARLYGQEPCHRYSIWRCDELGWPYWGEHQKKFGNEHRAALSALKQDMLARYFEHPFKQIYSSLLEVIRIVLFESPPQKLEDIGAPMIVLQGWHVIGSILFWVLAVSGVAAWREERSVAVCSAFLFIHFLFMSQVGNMTRYAFPYTPFLYLLAAIGAIRAGQRLISSNSS